jgi:hypothetical protein
MRKTMSRTVLCERTAANSQLKRRVDITLSKECKESVDRIIHTELQDDAVHDRPPRTKSAILEMLKRPTVRRNSANRKETRELP